MDVMSKLSYATEIPFKKKTFHEHLEVSQSPNFSPLYLPYGLLSPSTSPCMYLVCAPLKYLVSHLGPFSLTHFSSLNQESFLTQSLLEPDIMPYIGLVSASKSGQWLLPNATLPVLPAGASSQPFWFVF